MKGESGFTIIEVILAIFVMGMTLPSLLLLFAETDLRSANVNALPTATHLGAEIMEEIKSRKFDEQDEKDANGNWSATLGPDGGEGTNKANFDDVDDFDNWTQSFSSPFTLYSVSVEVDYVAGNALDTPLATPSPMPNDWTPSYKRVSVTVSHAGLPSDIRLNTIVTEAQTL